MSIDLTPFHHDLTFMSPLGEERAAALVRFVAGIEHGHVLDIGCGWAELLLRVVAAGPGLTGTGVDLDERAITHGRRLAGERGLGERVTLLAGDAAELAPSTADAVICIGSSQVWGAADDVPRPLDYAAALAAIRAKVPRGGRVLYGEAIWSRPPTDAAIAPLGGMMDEFVDLPELVDLAVAHGFMPMAVGEASIEEWDVFESGFNARHSRWLADHPASHPDADEVRARAARQRTSYLRGYRGILGLGYTCLVAL
ncbi:MAG TPA: class I SAM-dependent methyltransferase [Jiangellaceae bacterium]